MVFLENDSFLSELTKMFQKSKQSGSVMMTFKRYDGRDRHMPKDNRPQQHQSTQENMCLVRAKSRTKKISTVIHQRDINKFQVAYSSLLKGNLDGLKKLKKSKTKTKAE